MESLTTRTKESIRTFFILTNYFLWLVFSPSKFVSINKKEVKKIVIISTGAIGELLILTPLFPALKKELKCDITIAILNENRNVFKNNPYISDVIILKKRFKENRNILKDKKFDLAILLPGSFKNSLMCKLAKIKYQIGLGKYNSTQGPSLFFNKNFVNLKKQHVVEDNLDVIRLIGIENKKPKIEFYFSDKDKKRVEERLKKLKIKKYFIIHPGFAKMHECKFPTRLWPVERYAQIIDYLSEKYNYKILMTGTKEEEKLSEKIVRLVKDKSNVEIVAGEFTIAEFAYLIHKSKLIISPGTSAIHFASAFNTKTIELIGKERFYQWHPWMPKENYIVIEKSNICRGCNEMECRKKTTECLKAITAWDVKEAINKLLG